VSGSWPKIIRDPVHDIIPFQETPCDRLLLRLIETAEFQRLRRIKQLGMSELVFPGANHNRFAHSLGVMNMARRFLQTLERESGTLPEEQRIAVLTASLLHDVGHGPFSHTFEKVTEESHEARTIEIIQDSDTQVHQCLSEFNTTLPQTLAAFFDEDLEGGERAKLIPPHLTQVVSSQLDADRFDYLLRDSYATGTQYGRFDANWLLQHLHLDDDRKRFYLSHKGIIAAEAYVFARHHMYKTVYFHKTTRAAEVMLRLLFKRFKELLVAKKTKTKVVPNAPPAVVAAFSGPMSLGQFLLLDDYAISEFLKCCKSSADPIMSQVASGILDRRLYKAVDASDAAPGDVGQFASKVTEALRKEKHDPGYCFIDDTPSDTAYKPYDPDSDKPATQIYVETTLGQIKELSTESRTVQQLREPYALLRYYFPESLRSKIDPIARATLNRGAKK
jgi:HD superfamily phosphohydrolase